MGQDSFLEVAEKVVVYQLRIKWLAISKMYHEMAAEQATNPADIEPAAGGFETAEPTQEKSLSDTMKLPRKN